MANQHLTNVAVEFDGKVFVPQQVIDLPAGTRATVSIEAPPVSPPPPSQQPTEEQRREWHSEMSSDDREWQDILCQLQAAEPESGTLEETMRDIRMRP
jgi:hypothetical protein